MIPKATPDEEPNTPSECKPLLGNDYSVLFKTLWTDPRSTFVYLIEIKDEKWIRKWVKILFILAGISRSIHRIGYSFSQYSVDEFLWLIIPGIIWGVLSGLMLFYTYSALLFWIGNRVFKGTANKRNNRIIVAWSLLPIISLIAIVVTRFIILSILDSDIGTVFPAFIYTFVYKISVFIEVVLVIWSFLLLIMGVRIIQSFNLQKSISTILTSLIITVTFFYLIFNLSRLIEP